MESEKCNQIPKSAKRENAKTRKTRDTITTIQFSLILRDHNFVWPHKYDTLLSYLFNTLKGCCSWLVNVTVGRETYQLRCLGFLFHIFCLILLVESNENLGVNWLDIQKPQKSSGAWYRQLAKIFISAFKISDNFFALPIKLQFFFVSFIRRAKPRVFWIRGQVTFCKHVPTANMISDSGSMSRLVRLCWDEF